MANKSYRAASESAAVIPQSWLGVLKLSGSDRVEWLQAMISNDVEKLVAGKGCYAAHLNAQGKLVAQMNVLLDTDSILVITECASAARLAEVFDKLIIMEDVVVEDLSSSMESLVVMGPQAKEILESWLGEPLHLDDEFQHRRIAGYHVVRIDAGFEVWMRSEILSDAMNALGRNGAVAMDQPTWNVLRVESGHPLYGVDIDETTTLPEIGERGIRYDKGCYIGQEVVAKIKYLGHVNRRLMGFICEGETLPLQHAVIRSGGKDVGYITSSVVSPRMGKIISMGFVNRVAAVAGTPVEVVSGDATIVATVSELPFIPSSTRASD